MFHKHHKAFTMIELIFVIVVIGILSAIAIPKLAVTRGDAIMAKAKATVGAVRSSIAMERQKRILKGDFANPITTLYSADNAFDIFNADADGNTDRVLEYTVPKCETLGKTQGCWKVVGTNYRFMLPTSGYADFNITNSRFDCDSSDANCKLLTR